MNQQIAQYLEEQTENFATRFARCEGMLYFVACQILGTGEYSDAAVACAVEDAVNNCWHTASRNLQFFASEGAFRSWLVRILFNEALAILPKSIAPWPGMAAAEPALPCH